MFKTIGAYIARYTPFLYAVITAFRALFVLEFTKGHFRSSLHWSACDAAGNPLPWFTYPMIEYLNSLDLKNKKVFEWGSGNSTLYFSQRAKNIISIEHDKKWFDQIKSGMGENVSLRYFEKKQDYIHSIKGLFDVIIIDGLYRDECAKIAPQYLKEGGVIILDDGDTYLKATKVMDSSGLRKVPFVGHCPIIPQQTATIAYF